MATDPSMMRLAKIESFVRVSPTSPMNVKVLPMERSGKDGKELTPRLNGVSTLIDVKLLKQKVVVLAPDAYTSLIYPAADDKIFVMSTAWYENYLEEELARRARKKRKVLGVDEEARSDDDDSEDDDVSIFKLKKSQDF